MNRRGFLKVTGGTGLGLGALGAFEGPVLGQVMPAQAPSPKNIILTNASLIDGVQSEPQLKSTVVVKGGRIVRAGSAPPSRTESQEAQVMDLGGAWLLPGLCEAHSHFISPLQAPPRETVIDRYLRFGKGAIDALQVGVTCARVVGAPDFVDVAWRKAFARGMYLGPRLYVAGRTITCTGGHGSGYDYGQRVAANGPDDMRRVVREEIQGDVDLIKLVMSGGVFGVRSDNLDYNQFLPDEIEAAFQTAHQRGYKVAVHAGNAEGIKMAVRAGAYTIEHGYAMDEESIRLMVEHKTILVPTLCVTFLTQKAAESPYEKEWARQWPLPENLLQRAEERRRVHLESFKAALEAGVRIACGADQSPIAETTLLEIELLVRCGMSPMQAIMAATRISAEAATAEKEVGTVEMGKLADLLVVAANPLDSIHNLRKTVMIFKEGTLVVDKR